MNDNKTIEFRYFAQGYTSSQIVIIIIIISSSINIKCWTLWSVPCPKLQLRSQIVYLEIKFFVFVRFRLGNSPTSEFYIPTFRNTVLFHLHRQVAMKVILHTYLPMQTGQCSETSSYKIQMPRNYPEESIQHSEHGESLK